MIAAALIIQMVRNTLLDPDSVEWSEPELYRYLNAGVQSLVSAKPDVYTVTENLTLVDGSLQNLPDNAVQLFDIPRNVGGDAIVQASQNSLDNARPNWMQGDASDAIVHFVADNRNPRRFYVYPPSDGAVVEVVYAATVDTVGLDTGDTTDIPIPAVWIAPLWSYTVAMAYAKNSKRQDLQKMSAFMAQFSAAIGGKTQAQGADAPIVNNDGRQ